MPNRILQRDEFAAALNTRFQVTGEGAEVIELELVEVSDVISTRRQEKFSLLFQGPLHVLLPQRIYRMAHAQLGEIELFIVPVGMNEAGYSYEAVFNRLVE
jgi:hypothetical protein